MKKQPNNKPHRGAKPNGKPRYDSHRETDPAAAALLEESGITVGRNAVSELLDSGRSVEKIYLKKDGTREGSITVLVAKALKRKIPITEVDRSKLDAMSMGENHQGIIAVSSPKTYVELDDILGIAEERGEKPFIVICDRVADPHNLGAIIRSCEGAGVHGVVIPKRRGCGVTAAVMKCSAGAAEHMAICKASNLADAVDYLKEHGVWVVACEADGTPYDEIDYDMPLAVILGSEGEGVSRLLKDKSDYVASLPMLGHVNSLNVSCAGAVILYEVIRRRK